MAKNIKAYAYTIVNYLVFNPGQKENNPLLQVFFPDLSLLYLEVQYNTCKRKALSVVNSIEYIFQAYKQLLGIEYISQAYKQLLKLLFTAMVKANLISITTVHAYDVFHMQFPSMISPVTGLY